MNPIVATSPLGVRAWLGERAQDIASVLVLIAIWLVMVMIVDPRGNFPLNDDWVYARAVKSLLETGAIAMPGGTLANAIAQVYWGALFCLPAGFSFTALRISTLALGLAGVVGLYIAARESGARPHIAAIAALTLAVSPLYFGLAHTFMTDVPFTALLAIALAFLVRGLRRREVVSTTLGILVALASVLIRQFGIVVLLAYAVAHVVRYGARAKTLATAAAIPILGVAIHLVFQRWLMGSGGVPQPAAVSSADMLAGLGQIDGTSVSTIAAGLTYIGFLLFPFLIVAAPFRRPSGLGGRSAVIVIVSLIAFGTLLAGVVINQHVQMPALGNILFVSGLGPLTLRDIYILLENFPEVPPLLQGFWNVATAIGIVGATLALYCAGLVVSRMLNRLQAVPDSRDLWLVPLVGGAAVGYACVLAVFTHSYGFFDRYLLPFVPLIALLAASLDSERRSLNPAKVTLSLALLFLMLYAAFSMIATSDYLAWNRARWTLTDWMIAGAGISPHRIDGGYEFNGWHTYDPTYRAQPEKSWWYVDDDEFVVAAGPLPGYQVVAGKPVLRRLTGEQSEVFVLRRLRNSNSSLPDAAPVPIARATGPEGRTVAEVVAQAGSLEGKAVALRGRVVRYTSDVLGKNWLHLRDGSGSAADGSDDVLVTTAGTTKVGDVVLVRGVVQTNRDFGAGNAYKVLIEDATLEP